MEKGLLIKAEKLKGKMETSLIYNNIVFKKKYFKYMPLSAVWPVSLAYREMTSRYDTRIVRKSIPLQL